MNEKEGGLAGRKIVVDTYDSKLSADDARNSIIEACSKDFAIVGTTALFVNNVDDLVGCKDSKGAATGLPDFPVVTTEVVHQCSPVSFGINPPIIDCATKDQHPQTYRGSLGATNWYLKKYGKNALHGLVPVPVRPEVGEEHAGSGVHRAAAGGHQAGRHLRRVRRGPRRARTRRSCRR